jgi:hypothetical protein
MRYIAARTADGAARFRAMCESARMLRVAAGTLLYRQGDESSSFYVITRGSVDVLHTVGAAELPSSPPAPGAPRMVMGGAGTRLDGAARAALGMRLGVCCEGDSLGDFELQSHKRRITSVVARGQVGVPGGGGGVGDGPAAAPGPGDDDSSDDGAGNAASPGPTSRRPTAAGAARHGAGGARVPGRRRHADSVWAAEVRGMEARALVTTPHDAAFTDVMVVSQVRARRVARGRCLLLCV